MSSRSFALPRDLIALPRDLIALPRDLIALPSQSRTESIADMEGGRYARLRALGGIAFVSLPPSEYASALEATLRTGRCELDFRDEDGVCVCFLHGGELYLRTACGAVKGVVDMNSLCFVASPVVSSGFSTREAGRSDGSIYIVTPRPIDDIDAELARLT